ncbi:hypothetical protein D9611_008033 [Ephemerocybe angulata]|uniref:MYND-type domain-containing protein n=1 Tax=Ephemerocybe angulata TaxID=980116 RepID=A0A8H5C1C6_9AGAR|nr:hypothetical protein D9611_008033 [Tulosesus angulatus]
MTAVTPELIQRAATGSLPDLGLLADNIRGVKPYPIEALKVAFKFLHIDLVPGVERNWNDFRQPIARAVHCTKILHCAFKHPDLKTAVANQLIENVDGLCRWICCLLLIHDNARQITGWENGIPLAAYAGIATLVHSVLSLDDRVYEVYISSTEWIDIILHLWFRIDDNTGEPLLDINSRSIVHALCAVVMKEVGVEIFLHRIIEKRLVPRLAWTILRRARLASEDPSAADAIEYLRTLSATSSFLVASSSEDLHRAFGEANYLREFCSAINTLSITVQKSHATMLPRLAICVHRLSLMATKARTHVVENRCGLLEGGIVPLLVRVIPWADKSTEPHPDYADIVTRALTLHGLTHPRVIRRFLGMYPDREVPDLEGCSLATSERWECRWRQAFLFCKAYQRFDGVGVVTMCDNQACMHRAQERVSRQCAGCSSVVYCSAACQEEDWRAFHHHECSQARRDHAVRRSLHTWYSHSVRQFHTQWVADSVENIESEVFQRGGDAPLMHHDNPSETMVHLDFSKGEIATHFINMTRSVPTDILWSSRSNTAYPQGFLKPRHASLFQRYWSGLAGPKSRLAELVLCFGQHSYLDLIVLLEPVGGVYRGVYSIARHGYDSQVDLLPRNTVKLVPPSES